MQANDKKYQPDEQFTNEGWSAMQQVLDKELPVEKKKRRGFFWLFFYLGIGIIGGYLVFHPSAQTNISEDKPSTEIPQNQNIITTQKTSIEDFEIRKDSKILDKEVIKNKDVKPSKSIETLKDKEVNEGRVNEISEPIANNRNGVDDFFISKNTIQERDKVFYNNNITKNESPIKNAELISEKTGIDFEKIESPYFLLEKNEQEEIEFKENVMAFENAEKKKTKTKVDRKIEWIAHVGALLEFSNANELGSFGAVNVHFPINEKVGFRTGIGYSIMKKDLGYNFENVQSASTIAIDPINEGVAVAANTSFSLEEMHFIEVPFIFTYEPTKKFQTQLGINFTSFVKDKLLTLNNGASIVDDNASVGIYTLDDLDLSEVSYDNYLKESYWTELNINSVIGLQWKFHSKWNIELQYHHRWYDLLKKSESAFFDSPGGSYDSSFADVNFATQYTITPVLREYVISPSTNISSESISINNKDFKGSIRLAIGYKF